MTRPTVERNASRYEIRIGGAVAGFTEFVERERQRIFFHTEIDQAHRSKGLSSVLIEQALTDTREAGLRVVPVCPAVAAYLERHHGFDDIVDPVGPDILSWLNTTLS
jgi:predicted GNAT family acetyltransferase